MNPKHVALGLVGIIVLMMFIPFVFGAADTGPSNPEPTTTQTTAPSTATASPTATPRPTPPPRTIPDHTPTNTPVPTATPTPTQTATPVENDNVPHTAVSGGEGESTIG